MKRSLMEAVKEEVAEESVGEGVHDARVADDEGTWDAADDEGTWDAADDGSWWDEQAKNEWWEDGPGFGVQTCTWADSHEMWSPAKKEWKESWQPHKKHNHGYGYGYASSNSSSSGGRGGKYVNGGYMDKNNCFHPKLGLS